MLPATNQGCQHCYEPLALLKLACTPDWRYDGILTALCCELLTGSVRTNSSNRLTQLKNIPWHRKVCCHHCFPS